MSDKKYVFTVEKGEYSDHHTIGIFSSRKHAETIANMVNEKEDSYSQAVVCERLLDPYINEINEGLNVYHVIMDYDGTTERCDKTSFAYPEGLKVWERTKAEAWRFKRINDAIYGDVWAKDEKHAIKIANERRVQEIAAGNMKSRKVKSK